MRFVIDLKVCQDHGQCAYASSAFRMDENGKLAFRKDAEREYISSEFDESARDELEEAADLCPLQAIEIEG
ncbi:ferredoxin [Streptomyces sp. NPDC002520]